MKKKFLAVSAVCFLCIGALLIPGCITPRTREQKQAEAQQKKMAISYLKDKYGERFKAASSKCIFYASGEYGGFLDDIIVTAKSSDDEVVHVLCSHTDDGYGYGDDYQADVIYEDLYDTYISKLEQYIGEGNLDGASAVCNVNEDYNSETGFYTEYYDGNIEDYIEKEKISLKYVCNDEVKEIKHSPFIIPVEDKNEADEVLNYLKEAVEPFGDYTYLKFEIVNTDALSEKETEYLQKYEEGYYYSYTYDGNGDFELFEQKYEPLVDGIEADLSDEAQIMNQIDITKTNLTNDEINDMTNKDIVLFSPVYKIKAAKDSYQMFLRIIREIYPKGQMCIVPEKDDYSYMYWLNDNDSYFISKDCYLFVGYVTEEEIK